MTTAALIVDGLLGLLVLGLLAGGWRLNRKLDAVRGDRAELAALAEALGRASDRAEAAIAALDMRQAGVQALAEELRLMTEVGDNLARRLEAAASGARREATLEAIRGLR